MVPHYASCQRPALVLGHRPEPRSRLQSPHEPAPGRRFRGAEAAAVVRRSPRGGAETARPRARAAPPGSTGDGRTHRRDDHPARHAASAPGPHGGRCADSGRDAARGRRDLPGAPRGRRRTVERLSRLPASGRPAERAGKGGPTRCSMRSWPAGRRARRCCSFFCNQTCWRGRRASSPS